jgi:hypothetical protein
MGPIGSPAFAKPLKKATPPTNRDSRQVLSDS